MNSISAQEASHARPKTFDRLSVLVHWTIFILVVVVCILGFLFYKLDYKSSAYAAYYYWHRSLGEIIFVLTIISVLHRTTRNSPGEFPDTRWRAMAARVTKSLLLVLLILVPAFKLWRGAYGPMGWSFFMWHIPGIWPPNASMGKFLTNAHYYSAIMLIALATLHSAAALWHHYVRKDRLIRRMSPF
ncbi:cytochrome b [Paraburkholderia phosphatilytica]|uniref:cytochrome b n=1 Tax=Paraburkholderia phosphatilytica TaxID=2282883 RepID=UPI0013DFB1A6|nr:cytochrome b/b6 domain-containing protein [Paraburkholderia phosphatilytica]